MKALFPGHTHPPWTVPRGSENREEFSEAGSREEGGARLVGHALKTAGECPYLPGEGLDFVFWEMKDLLAEEMHDYIYFREVISPQSGKSSLSQTTEYQFWDLKIPPKLLGQHVC